MNFKFSGLRRRRAAVTTSLAFLTVAVLAGCGSATGSASGGGVDTLRYTINSSSTSPRADYFNYFSDQVKSATAGKMEVQPYWNSSLGGAQQLAVQAVKAGGASIADCSSSNFSQIDPAFGFFDLPFLFKNGNSDLYKFMDSPRFKTLINDTAKSQGLHYLFSVYEGYRVPLTSKKAVHVPSDMSGLKVRTTGSQVESSYMDALGAKPTSLAFPTETYQGLKQGLVDGLSVAWTSITQYSLDDAVEYGAAVNLVPIVSPQWMSEAAYQKLSPEAKAGLDKAAAAAETHSREIQTKLNDEALAKLKSDGIQVYTPTAAEMEQWRTAVQPTYAKFGDSPAYADIIKSIQSAN